MYKLFIGMPSVVIVPKYLCYCIVMELKSEPIIITQNLRRVLFIAEHCHTTVRHTTDIFLKYIGVLRIIILRRHVQAQGDERHLVPQPNTIGVTPS